MYELMIETQFSAAHQLRGYRGKCENLHGHNWRVQVTVSSEDLNDIGLAIDFHELKELTVEVLKNLDHSFLNDVFPFTELNPSSENIAKWVYESLRKKINGKEVSLSAVTVWESDSASATYFEQIPKRVCGSPLDLSMRCMPAEDFSEVLMNKRLKLIRLSSVVITVNHKFVAYNPGVCVAEGAGLEAGNLSRVVKVNILFNTVTVACIIPG